MDCDSLQTPPDTVAVRKALLRHRDDLVVAKHTLTPAEDSATDDTFKAHRPGSAAFSSPGVSSGAECAPTAVADVLLYRSPYSVPILVGGLFALTSAGYIASGAHSVTLLSALAYAAFAELAVNFAKSVLSPAPQTAWAGGALVSAAMSGAAWAVDRAAAAHDEFLTARDPAVTLQVGAGLWALALAGRLLSFWTLATVAFGAAFTVPYQVSTNWEAVSGAWSAVSATAAARFKALGLNRKQQAAAVLAVLAFVWMRSSWATRLMGVLLAAMAVRVNLKPAEVAAIRQHAAPLTMSVKKRAARFSIAASDFAVRTLGSKAHAR